MTTIRSSAERKARALADLERESTAWIASGNTAGEGYLVPLTYLWENGSFLFATPVRSRTARDLRRAGKTRLSLPSTVDVVIVDGVVEFPDVATLHEMIDRFAAKYTWDPRQSEQEYAFFRVIPRRIQVWRNEPELEGRDVMIDGVWQV